MPSERGWTATLRRSPGSLLALGLLGALAVGEFAHFAVRFRAASEQAVQDAVAQLVGSVSRQASRLETDLDAARSHAAYLASLDSVRSLLTFVPSRPRDDEAAFRRRAVSKDAIALLHHFPRLFGLAVRDATGREWFRAEKQGGGVAILPPELLHDPDFAKARLASDLRAGEVRLLPLEFDARRVEVAERDRQMLRYVAPIVGERNALGSVELSLSAAPLFESIRRGGEPWGAVSFLVDREGGYLAHPDRGKEMGAVKGTGESFARDFPEASAAILRGARMASEAGHRFVGEATGPKDESIRPTWLLVSDLPPGAQRALATSLRREMGATVVVLAAAVLAILGVTLVLFRLVLAEARSVTALERANADAARRRREELARLTAGVAHEINNPLEGIRNYLRVLEREGAPADKRGECLDGVRHGFDRIRVLARDLLQVAHPRALRLDRVSIDGVLDRIASTVRHDPSFQGIRLEMDRGPDVPELSIDAFAIEQVLLNLCMNARQAMGGEGMLRIAVRAATEIGWVELEVTDTGPGIPLPLLGELFEPFRTGQGGTGLGLSISRSLVQAHGGTIVADNPPSGGARFRVRLPVEPPQDGALRRDVPHPNRDATAGEVGNPTAPAPRTDAAGRGKETCA